MPTNISISLWYNGPGEPAFPDKPELGECPHAEVAMRELGIFYRDAQPRSVTDSWMFIDCMNIPDILPKWAYRYESGGNG